jgi:hypothetical protein
MIFARGGMNAPSIRSFCSRSIITTSLPGNAASKSVKGVDAQALDAFGHQGRRRDNAHLRAQCVRLSMLERATRLCSTSPQMVTISPSI